MPENNVIVETAKCVWVSNEKKDHLIVINQKIISYGKIFVGGSICYFQCSFVEKAKRSKKEKLPETLDYAENRFGKEFVADVKALKNVSYMFIPMPLFWALFDQQVKLQF